MILTSWTACQNNKSIAKDLENLTFFPMIAKIPLEMLEMVTAYLKFRI